MSVEAARRRHVEIRASGWMFWGVVALVVVYCACLLWWDWRDGAPVSARQAFTAIAAGLAILTGYRLERGGRTVVVLDEAGVSLRVPWLRIGAGLLWRTYIRWDDIDEVWARSWQGYNGVVLIPKGGPSESSGARMLRRSGIWPPPLMIDATWLEVGAEDLAQMIRKRLPRTPRPKPASSPASPT